MQKAFTERWKATTRILDVTATLTLTKEPRSYRPDSWGRWEQGQVRERPERRLTVNGTRREAKETLVSNCRACIFGFECCR